MSWNRFRALAWRVHRRYRLLRVYKYNLFKMAVYPPGALPARRGWVTVAASFLLGLGAAGGTLWALKHRPQLPGLAGKPAFEVSVPAPLPAADPAAANRMLEKAEALVAKGGPEAWKTAATEYLHPAVAADPRNPRARALLAFAYLRLSDSLPRDQAFLHTVNSLLQPRKGEEWTVEAAAAKADWLRLTQRPDEAARIADLALAKRQSPYLKIVLQDLKDDEAHAARAEPLNTNLAPRGPASALVREARELEAKGELEKAKDKYMRAVEADRLDPVPMYELGLLHLKLGEEPEAHYRLQKTLELPGAPFDAAITLANHLSTRYELKKARQALDWAGRHAGEDPRRLAQLDHALGYHALRDHLPEEAETHFARGLARPFGSFDLFLQAADIAMEKKQDRAAEFYYAQALRESPLHPKAVLGLALTRFNIDSPSRAVDFLKGKLAQKPNSAALLTDLAIIYLRSGDQLSGKNYLQNAVRADSRYAEAFRLLGDLTKDEGNRQSDFNAKRHSYRYALASYEMYSRLAPNDPEGYKLTADLYFDIRDLGAAARNYHKVLEFTPNYPEVRLRLAQIARNGGDADRAMDLLAEEMKVNPRGDAAYVERANIHMARKDFRAAGLDFMEATKRNERNSDALFGLGVIHHLQGAYDNALALFTKCVKLDPLKRDIYWQMGLIYQKQGNRTKAIQAFVNYKALARDLRETQRADEKIRMLYAKDGTYFGGRSYASTSAPEPEPGSLFDLNHDGVETFLRRGNNLVSPGQGTGVGAFSPERNFRTFANQFITFQIPESWECALVNTNWACQDTNEELKRDSVVIVSAKIKKPGLDELPVYMAHFGKPRRYQSLSGENITSEPKYVRQVEIAGRSWVESVHFQGELPDFYTRYFATVEGDLGIVMAMNVRKDRWSEQLSVFERLTGSLRAYRKPGPVNEAPALAQAPTPEVAGPGEPNTAPPPLRIFERLSAADQQRVQSAYALVLTSHEKRDFTALRQATRAVLSLVDEYKDTRFFEGIAERGLAREAEAKRRRAQEQQLAELRRSVSGLEDAGNRLASCAELRPELFHEVQRVGTLLLEKDPGNRKPLEWEQRLSRAPDSKKRKNRAPAYSPACRNVFYGPEKKRASR